LLELRYLVRRRKAIPKPKSEGLVTQLEQLFRVIIPDELALLRANTLQADHELGPIDAVQLATAMFETPCTFVSRDAALLKVARLFIPAKTPEELVGSTP
jgi:predicted nucleic acid-binding protein